ncbi:MAG: LysR substrate-binding domain-containing protein [Erythrobacter sp.]
MRLKNIPSIDLLRSFDSTARLLSFTKAAEELFLTQSAVSRQIKTLEDQLGLPLYVRGVRKLTLTEAGRRLAKTVDAVIRQLEATIATLDELEPARTLGISTTVSFAALWLIPRLATFRARNPDVDVRVSATSEVQNIKRERLDIAIRYARPERIPQGTQVLFQEEVFAVCSPGLCADPARPLHTPADLQDQVLLHMDDACGEWDWYMWSTWLESRGLSGLRPAGSVRFSQYDQMIQAAIAGQGVALGRHPLIRRLLTQGALVAPFAEEHISSGAYYLVTEPGSETNPDVLEFKSWLFTAASVSD